MALCDQQMSCNKNSCLGCAGALHEGNCPEQRRQPEEAVYGQHEP